MGNLLSTNTFDEDDLVEELIHFIEQEAGLLLPTEKIEEYLKNGRRVKRKRRVQYVNMWETAWGRQLQDENLTDEMSYEAKLFRRRFRLPYIEFQELLEHCKEQNIFGPSRKIPVEFKVLMGLRILGRGSCLDAVQEVTNCGLATINNIFKQFVNGCATKLYEMYVSIPEGEELQKVKYEYSKMGLPGCVDSVNSTAYLEPS